MKIYRVYSPDLAQTLDDARRIMAHDEQDAAQLWSQRNDAESADYAIANGAERMVVAFEEGTTKTASFRVTAEVTPTYIARRL